MNITVFDPLSLNQTDKIYDIVEKWKKKKYFSTLNWQRTFLLWSEDSKLIKSDKDNSANQ